MTSKRRNGAGRGSRGMWGREAGEAAVWMAARPRGRRPAHLGTSCSFGWWPRTCTKPARLPQPNDSRPVPQPGIPGERIRRGPLPLLFPDTHRPPLGLFLQLLALTFPSPKLYTSAGPITKSQGGPGSVREHMHLCSLRGPLPNLNLSLLWQQRRRGREENGSRKDEEIKLGKQVAQPRAWILGEGFGLVPEDQNQKRERGRESPKLAEKLENDNSSTAFT